MRPLVCLLAAAGLFLAVFLAGAAPVAQARKDAQKERAQPRDARPARGERPRSSPDRPRREDLAKESAKASAKNVGKSRGHDDVPAPAASDPERARIERLQEALRAELSSSPLGKLRVGLHVADAHTGRLFYRRHADALMDPASNQKVVATSAALLRLGADWHFTTTLKGNAPDADGVVTGPLYLRGDGDPTLRTADFEELAARLVARGVTKIEGAVLADARHRESRDERDQDRPALLVNHSLVSVRVRPGDVGQPPLLAIEPETSTWQIENEARTVAKGRTRVNVTVTSRVQDGGGRLVVYVSGRIGEDSPGAIFRRRVSHPAVYSAAVMRGALLRAGIAVSGEAGIGNEPADAHTLASHASPPLSTLLRRVNKDSDNDQAERVLDALGATIGDGPPSAASDLAALRVALADFGISPSSYVSRNGSGLGHENRITADMMASLFRSLHTDPRLGPELEQSLSVGGVDGTTRNRFKGTPESHRVRAKTGTLNGKSCLSGLVGDDGEVLAFSILVQGLRHRSLTAVRQAQVRAVSAMMRYLRDSTINELPPEGGGVPDFETGEEPSEMEGETDDPSGTPGGVSPLGPTSGLPGGGTGTPTGAGATGNAAAGAAGGGAVRPALSPTPVSPGATGVPAKAPGPAVLPSPAKQTGPSPAKQTGPAVNEVAAPSASALSAAGALKSASVHAAANPKAVGASKASAARAASTGGGGGRRESAAKQPAVKAITSPPAFVPKARP